MSRRKEIIKFREEINEIESKKVIQKINEFKSLFFEKINKMGKPLTRLIKEKRERIQINKIRNEREVTTDNKEIQRMVRKYFNNYMPTNWTTWTKYINSWKYTVFQN